jgi:hypothetical protein
MNNKGFAITTILYGVLILFCLLLVSMLGILASYRGNLEKLLDKNNGARAIAQKGTINTATFVSASGVGTYLGNGVYGYKKTGKWSSYCLQPSLFQSGGVYEFSYSFQKTAGSLINIGGHSTAAKDVSFYLDGHLQEGVSNSININPYHDVGPSSSGYAPEQNISNDDTEIHNIVLKFTYVPATGDNGGIICIQPNRGLDTTVEGKIFDLSLKK